MDAREIEVAAGTIRFREAGTGPAIVFVHGYLVDGRLWDGVAEALSGRFHVVVPDLPFGAHKVPMKPDARLDAAGLATIVDDFIAALGLEDVTLVGNDSGGAVSQIVVSRRPARVGRLVLTNCDTYENFPPGIFKAMPRVAKLPGGMWAMAQPFRIPAISRRAFAAFTKSGARDELVADWTGAALSDRALMRDLAKVTPWGDDFEGLSPAGRHVVVERSYVWKDGEGGDILCEVRVCPNAALYDRGVGVSAVIVRP